MKKIIAMLLPVLAATAINCPAQDSTTAILIFLSAATALMLTLPLFIFPILQLSGTNGTLVMEQP